MFVGHLAAALGSKRLEPRIPLGASVAAAFGLDLLWPIFLLLGLETVRVNPGDTAFTNLAFDSYPWSHSLLVVIGWAGLGAFFGRGLFGSWRSGMVLGGLVLSHWVFGFVHAPARPTVVAVRPGGRARALELGPGHDRSRGKPTSCGPLVVRQH